METVGYPGKVHLLETVWGFHLPLSKDIQLENKKTDLIHIMYREIMNTCYKFWKGGVRLVCHMKVTFVTQTSCFCGMLPSKNTFDLTTINESN